MKLMKLWILSPTTTYLPIKGSSQSFDDCCLVIRASSERGARALALKEGGNFIWGHRDTSTCKPLTAKGATGIIVKASHATITEEG